MKINLFLFIISSAIILLGLSFKFPIQFFQPYSYLILSIGLYSTVFFITKYYIFHVNIRWFLSYFIALITIIAISFGYSFYKLNQFPCFKPFIYSLVAILILFKVFFSIFVFNFTKKDKLI